MIIFHVRHYLNKAGIKYFNQWFLSLKKVLTNQKGFISAKYAIDTNSIEIVDLFMEFKDSGSMQEWRASIKHEKIKSLLEPYKEKQHSSNVYKVNESFYKDDCL